MEVGIEAFGLQFPRRYLDVRELARVRGVDPQKYLVGLGCERIAVCADGESIVDLLAGAAERALKHWGGDRSRVGMLAVGTESATDMSRPLSAWVAERLGLSGAIRSYEVKHGCYGGTLAVRQSVEWLLSGNARGQVALVIGGDIAQYAERDPGEPTQGAGAVAMIVGEPRIAAIDATSYAWSQPVFDFWHPNDQPYPTVDGPFSLECYKAAAVQCFAQFLGDQGAAAVDDCVLHAFHVPFPKMVRKAVDAVGLDVFGWTSDAAGVFYDCKVAPTMRWNRLSGNSYAGSLWVAVAAALSQLDIGDRLSAFSYGSGFGAELLTLRAGAEAGRRPWVEQVEADFEAMTPLSGEEYLAFRNGT